MRSSGPSDRKDQAFADWRRLRIRVHVLVVTGLALLVLVRYDDLLVHPEAWIDESIYEEGFEALLAGRSPYTVDLPEHGGFYYPPPFAHAGAFVYSKIGGPLLRVVARTANVLSVAWLAWLAVAWLPPPRGDTARGLVLRLFVAALIVVSPVGVEFGFKVGNISFIIAALVVTAVMFYPWRPILAGVLIGFSLVLKPMAPAVAAVLFAGRPGAGPSGSDRARGGRIAAVVAGVTAGLLMLPFLSELGDMLTMQLSKLVRGRILSVYRIVDLFGVPFDRSVIFALLALVLMVLAWRFGRSHSEMVALALGGVVLTAPALWAHTMTIFFPVLVIAACHAYRHWTVTRHTRPGTDQDRRAASELSLVAVAFVATLYFQSGGFDHLASGIQIGLLVPLLVIPLFLVAYVLWASTRGVPGDAVPGDADSASESESLAAGRRA